MEIARYPHSQSQKREICGLVLGFDRIVDIQACVAAVASIDFSTMLGIIRGGETARRALDAIMSKPIGE